MMVEVHQVMCCEEETWVSLGLFSNVSNASWLRDEATSGRMLATLLDPSMIVSSFHVLAAVNKALVLREQNQMKTKNIYSEIIFSLSPSTNITSSFKTFAIKDISKNLLVVEINQQSTDSKFSQFEEQVEGTLVPLGFLSSMHQVEEIIKFYQIPPEEQAISSLENSVVTRLTIKDVT